MAMAADAVRDLDEWLTPFLEGIGRKTRRTWAPLYVRGLLGPGERNSLQPMATQLGLAGHDQLQHFIASPVWDDGPLWTVLAHEADRLIGGPQAVLVIDDTALPKQGTLSVGVARQYCGQLGKRANCQALVSLTLANGEVPIPLGLRLFLPQAWTDDPARCAAAGVPEAEIFARSKGALHSPRWTACGRLGCGSAPCWPMPAMGQAPPSAMASMPVGCAGRSASRAPRWSMAETSG
jgi:SRSO17 transposase